jgi:uncharacterized 2Fe-2S/4Fe-4S cluster protein (DUF4445 family)
VRVEAPDGVAPRTGGGAYPAVGVVSPPMETETRLLGADLLDTGLRLACQARVQGDARVFVPEESRRSAQVVAKEARERVRQLDPAVRTYDLDLPLSLPREPAAAAALLLSALAEQRGLTGLECEPEASQTLAARAAQAADGRQAEGRGSSQTPLTAIVWRGRASTTADGATGGTVLDVRPAARSGRVLGLALDVGTTTIAAYLADLTTGEILATESALNPQVAFGDDIISRMQHAAHNPGGGAELQQVVVAEVNRLAREATQGCRTDVADILDVVMVGNTAMHHLFMGLDTDSLRRAPFAPAVRHAIDTRASAVGLNFHPACRLYALPNEAGFVGADNVGVIIAEEPYRQKEVVLLIDVGTNGELVLGGSRRMLSASCATGPAFEGAHIEHGMRATPGAIERIRIEPQTLEVSFKVVGTDAWSPDLPAGKVLARGICGSGIIEAAAEMLRAGVILPDGGFNPALSHKRVLLEQGRPRKFVIAREEESATGRAITVSLKDIRAVQLGKAALRAGAEILLGLYGIQKPERVVLAGAFGSYIDKYAALAIGMLPDCDPERVASVGNAAGDGALLALLSVGKRREAEWVAEAVEYVELASVPDFQKEYVKAMRFGAPGADR